MCVKTMLVGKSKHFHVYYYALQQNGEMKYAQITSTYLIYFMGMLGRYESWNFDKVNHEKYM